MKKTKEETKLWNLIPGKTSQEARVPCMCLLSTAAKSVDQASEVWEAGGPSEFHTGAHVLIWYRCFLYMLRENIHRVL